MRSSLHDLLPLPTRRALDKLGRDLATARRKRHFTVAMMVEVGSPGTELEFAL